MALASPDPQTLDILQSLLARFPQVQLAVLFGSMASGNETPDSDIDIAVQMPRPMSAAERIALTEAIALAFKRPVDLIDLRTVGQPLLDQIVGSGKQVAGTRHLWGDLIYRNIMENEDFVPYQKRILEGRRRQWMKD